MQRPHFVDAVSGTNGIAGAADTVIVLARPRTEDRGLFKVTGRDVVEQEYAVTVAGGHWSLIGGDLEAAAEAAHTVRATANLSDRSAEIVRFVNLQPNGVRAADVAAFLDVDDEIASRYLRRLHDSGRIDRPARGLYAPVRSVRSVRSSETNGTEPDTVSGPASGFLPGFQAQPDAPDGSDMGVPS